MATDTQDCIFCQIVAGKVPCFKIYEDERTLAFADINPVTEGHTLVIPKAHAENLLDITPGDLAAVHQTAQKIARAQMACLKATGVTMVQLSGEGANQVVMHYHVHLIPRDRSKDGLDKFEWESKPGNMRSIERVAGKIKDAL